MDFDIQSIKRKLLIKYPFFGSILANLDYIEHRGCCDYNGNPTAATDGETIYYHPDFMSSLLPKQQIFVIAHEVCHVAFDHMNRGKNKDKEIWNIATDAVINSFLKNDDLEMLDGCVDIPGAMMYDAEQLYEKLLHEKKEETSSKKDAGHDTHRFWDEKEKNQTDTLNKDGDNGKLGNSKDNTKEGFEQEKCKECQERKDELKRAIERISEVGEKEAFRINKITRKQQLQEIRDALTKESLSAGGHTQSNQRIVKNIGNADPLIDWRLLLREAVKVEVDWSSQNAVIENGVLVSQLIEIPQPETEILLDTSGSINEVLLRNFLRECKNILQVSKIKVGCFDTRFYGFKEIRTEQDIDDYNFLGGGGTDFDVVVESFSNRVGNKIVFTDGNANMPHKTLNAIWIVFGNEKINPPGGRVIYINEEYLQKLCYYDRNQRSR